MTIDGLRCFHMPTKRIYDVLGINNLKREVIVKGMKLNGTEGNTYTTAVFSFDHIEWIFATDKRDKKKQVVFAGDKLQVCIANREYIYLDVEWSNKHCAWITTKDGKFFDYLRTLDSRYIEVQGTKFGGVYYGSI